MKYTIKNLLDKQYNRGINLYVRENIIHNLMKQEIYPPVLCCHETEFNGINNIICPSEGLTDEEFEIWRNAIKLHLFSILEKKRVLSLDEDPKKHVWFKIIPKIVFREISDVEDEYYIEIYFDKKLLKSFVRKENINRMLSSKTKSYGQPLYI